MNEFIAQISPNVIGSVIGGIIVAILTLLFPYLRSSIRHWRFRRIFGSDVDGRGEFRIIYAKLSLPELFDQNGEKTVRPYIKQPRRSGSRSGRFSIENPVSGSEFRGASYIVSSFGSILKGQPDLTSDIDADPHVNLSFVSLGGPFSNWKTNDAFDNTSNQFLRMTTDDFVSAKSGNLVLDRESSFDYGLILRIRPEQFSERVWIVCAGIGEWGTSGAAWFLSNKWKEILKATRPWYDPRGLLKGADFATIVQVKPGQDEFAKMVRHFKNFKEVELAAEELGNKKPHAAGPTTTVTQPPSGSISSTSSRSKSGSGRYRGISAVGPDEVED
ncbi:hypothetical protein KA005_69535 [bacterium]|nr:hypothetical protein [bacterium]